MPGKISHARLRRPKKGFSDRQRRMKVQRKRLVALGVPEDKAAKLDSLQLRSMLKRPSKIKRSA